MDLSLGRRGGPRLASRAALLLVGGALSCFTGDLLAQQPCERDDGTAGKDHRHRLGLMSPSFGVDES